ncbi:MAG: arginine--tRNA ligase [Opitutales bacterium]
MPIAFDLAQALTARVAAAAATLDAFDETFSPDVQPSANPKFGDFQANGVLAFAKRQKLNPRGLAEELVLALKAQSDGPECELEVAGPGFVNFTLTPAAMLEWLRAYGSEEAFRNGAGALKAGKKVIVDYPSPNTAKQMHIGHLRPMAIGEAVSRLVEFCGAEVIRDNHIGDWGTNFGTLIAQIKREGVDIEAMGAEALPEIERLYKAGTSAEEADPAARDVSRAELAKLQQGNSENTRLWERIVEISQEAFQRIYDEIGLQSDVTLGESFYRDKVERVYQELKEVDLAEDSEGALVVWHEEVPKFSRESERPYPFNIRKRDGSSNYASTDLATVLYRLEHFQADEIVYITDDRQQDHFEQLFLTVEKWFARKGYHLPELRHVMFGKILGEDKKPIKTRAGTSIKLAELIEEAKTRAAGLTGEKSLDLLPEERAEVARAVGLGALKYVDLSSNRTADYVFSWDRLMTFEGNSAPYLQMAGARIHNIFRKAEAERDAAETYAAATPLETPGELALARKIIGWPAALRQALADLRPHFLCTYLYELAGQFSTFYNADHVQVEDPAIRARRLLLCARTLAVLESGLRLLNIQPVERM